MRQIPTSRLDWIPELTSAPGLHFDEHHRSISLDDQIDVAVAAPESALNNAPSLTPEPPLGDPLSKLAKRLRGR